MSPAADAEFKTDTSSLNHNINPKNLGALGTHEQPRKNRTTVTSTDESLPIKGVQGTRRHYTRLGLYNVNRLSPQANHVLPQRSSSSSKSFKDKHQFETRQIPNMRKPHLCFIFLAFACVAAAPGVYAARESQVQQGTAYLHQLCEDSKAPVATLTEAIRNGSLSAAKDAYTASRSYYEQIEVLAVSFPETDTDIDARPYAGFAKGEQDSEYRGFHKIEYLIFRDEDLETALGYAETLEASVDTLCVELTETGRFSQELTWLGAMSLAIEVPAKKISSEEETWSDLSMMIFRENLKGIWGVISPFLSDMSTSIRADVQSAYDELVKEFDEICPQYPFNTSSGMACLYSTISVSDRRSIVSDYYSLANAMLAAKAYLNISDPVEEGESTGTPTPTPAPTAAATCVEEAWLLEHDVSLLHETNSVMAEVVCPIGFPCGTKDHVVIMNHVAMSYGDLCTIQPCTTKHTFVNGFRAHQMIPLGQNGNWVTGHVTYQEHGLQNLMLGVVRMQYTMGMYSEVNVGL